MTGTISEDTEFSATAATPNQTLTMVAGSKVNDIMVDIPGMITTHAMAYGYDDGVKGDRSAMDVLTQIGTLEPNVIRFNGKEYTVNYFMTYQESTGTLKGTKIGFPSEPPFNKMKLNVNGEEMTASKGYTGAAAKTFTLSSIVTIESGDSYTIKVVSIE